MAVFIMCQCPISGALHFYKEMSKMNKKTNNVSMPYLGRTSFLPVNPDGIEWYLCIPVSMPYLGRTSFLRHLKGNYR